MRISSMSYHALHLLFRLANQSDTTPLSASEFADTCGISEHFIHKIMRSLQRGKIVRSIRGIAGGHVLARSSTDISLADIILAVEGGITLPEIKADVFASSTIVDVWSLACQRMLECLHTITLNEVIAYHNHHTEKCQVVAANRVPETARVRHNTPSLGRLRCRRRPHRPSTPTSSS